MAVPAAFHHTCFVVRDLEATAQRLSDSLGIGPWYIWTIEPPHSVIRGKPTPFSFRLAFATVGGGTMELITPRSGRSVFAEQLEQHGAGFNHTCFVYASIDDLRTAKRELLQQGRELIMEASAGDAFDLAYFVFPEIGSAVEILYLDSTKMPMPESVIQPALAAGA